MYHIYLRTAPNLMTTLLMQTILKSNSARSRQLSQQPLARHSPTHIDTRSLIIRVRDGTLYVRTQPRVLHEDNPGTGNAARALTLRRTVEDILGTLDIVVVAGQIISSARYFEAPSTKRFSFTRDTRSGRSRLSIRRRTGTAYTGQASALWNVQDVSSCYRA